MNKYVELKQAPDDSWRIEETLDNGMIRATPLPPLSKEQAIRETQRRGYRKIISWDKEVMAAIQKGEVA